MSQEVRREETYPNVNPWDMLVWKIDTLEKYIQRENENVRREINDIRQEMKDIRQEIKDIRQELKDVRQEVGNVRREANDYVSKIEQKIDGYRQRVEEELRTVHHSFTILEWTAILGFAGIIVTIIVAAKFF
ncbi:MAG: hypothetical protein ACPLQP_01155 [Moorellaceae bacterium]